MHSDQFEIDERTVRALVDAQFPDFAGETIRKVPSSGTVNAIFRIGDNLAARLPLQPQDPETSAALLASEAEAAKKIAKQIPVPVPQPVAIGAPSEAYPSAWSIQTWIEGSVATSTTPGSSPKFVADLIDLILELRAADTHGETFKGDNRGGNLKDHDEWMAECLRRSKDLLDTALLGDLWSDLRALDRTSPDVMSHTDLIPGNVLFSESRLVGLLDVGGFAAADPALDLVAGWHLLDDANRLRLREGVGADDLEWRRGKAWAFEQAMGAVWYYIESNSVMSSMGIWTLQRIVSDETGGRFPIAPATSRVWNVAGGPRISSS